MQEDRGLIPVTEKENYFIHHFKISKFLPASARVRVMNALKSHTCGGVDQDVDQDIDWTLSSIDKLLMRYVSGLSPIKQLIAYCVQLASQMNDVSFLQTRWTRVYHIYHQQSARWVELEPWQRCAAESDPYGHGLRLAMYRGGWVVEFRRQHYPDSILHHDILATCVAVYIRSAHLTKWRSHVVKATGLFSRMIGQSMQYIVGWRHEPYQLSFSIVSHGVHRCYPEHSFLQLLPSLSRKKPWVKVGVEWCVRVNYNFTHAAPDTVHDASQRYITWTDQSYDWIDLSLSPRDSSILLISRRWR